MAPATIVLYIDHREARRSSGRKRGRRPRRFVGSGPVRGGLAPQPQLEPGLGERLSSHFASVEIGLLDLGCQLDRLGTLAGKQQARGTRRRTTRTFVTCS